jgi:hypothetical protein
VKKIDSALIHLKKSSSAERVKNKIKTPMHKSIRLRLTLARALFNKIRRQAEGFEDGFIYLFICLLQIASLGNVLARMYRKESRQVNKM